MTSNLSSHALSSALQGRRVVITQAAHQASAFAALLERWGALPLLYPCLAIQLPADSTALDQSLRAAAQGGFDWLVLTSANTVRILAQRLAALDISPQQLGGVRIAVVGAATARSVQEELGLHVALVSQEEVAEGLAAALEPVARPGERILLPQSALARDVLFKRLTAIGASVHPIVAYETVRGAGGVDLPDLLAQGRVDAVTLASASALRFLLERLTDEGGDPALLHSVCLACIGPMTARAVQEAGFTPAVVSTQQSLEGLAAALAAYFTRKDSHSSRQTQGIL
ncbi:MAG: uroporphyrinogen-III synthase [Caldilinea sp.]|nr:uroporphyrinogen-III synthase [Caldilinea sp.]MDW8441636.1 uroporphyrinogen-III synthase [Caldilineaceae bacterium]